MLKKMTDFFSETNQFLRTLDFAHGRACRTAVVSNMMHFMDQHQNQWISSNSKDLRIKSQTLDRLKDTMFRKLCELYDKESWEKSVYWLRRWFSHYASEQLRPRTHRSCKLYSFHHRLPRYIYHE